LTIVKYHTPEPAVAFLFCAEQVLYPSSPLDLLRVPKVLPSFLQSVAKVGTAKKKEGDSSIYKR